MELCEFLAEEELIEIIPNFKYNKQLNLISGDFGPFQPSIPTKVPLWLALNLKRQHKCTVIIPKWVSELIKSNETQMGSDGKRKDLIQVPHEYWREILKLLESYCDLEPNCGDLIERREAILKASAHALFRHAFDSEPLLISDVSVHNVSRAELHIIKFIVQKAFAFFQKLRIQQLLV